MGQKQRKKGANDAVVAEGGKHKQRRKKEGGWLFAGFYLVAQMVLYG